MLITAFFFSKFRHNSNLHAPELLWETLAEAGDCQMGAVYCSSKVSLLPRCLLESGETPAVGSLDQPFSKLQVFFVCRVCYSSKAEITFWTNLMGGKRPSSVAVIPSQAFKLVEAVISPPKEIILLSKQAGEHNTCTTVISDDSSMPHPSLTI